METVEFLRLLAQHKANAVPAPLRHGCCNSLALSLSLSKFYLFVKSYIFSLLKRFQGLKLNKYSDHEKVAWSGPGGGHAS